MDAQIKGQLEGQQAGSESSALQNIEQQNEQLKNANYWKAVAGLGGMYDPLGFASASNGAANSVAGLSEAVTQSNQSQLLGALGGIAGGAGTAVGSIWKKGGRSSPAP